ncbi:MAG: hypothetical protein QG670_593 [Thermoproteota archaeon]|nr:hypothetical protein [Thermoproteota archaeon]
MKPEKRQHFFQRSRLEIIASLLYSAYDGSRKTRLIYKCNLSLSQFNKYTDFLIQGGLLNKEVDGKGIESFHVTEKGKAFIKDYEKIMKNLEKMQI